MCLLAVSLFFVSCDKDKDNKVTPLTLDKENVTVVVGATDVVTIKTGEAPFKTNVRMPEIASVTIDKTKATIKGLKEGERVPNVVFKARVRDEKIGGSNPFKWKYVSTSDLFANKRVVLFALPGGLSKSLFMKLIDFTND